MIRFGEEPFLECSSRGEKRLSAFYARIRWRNNRSIEELYQSFKMFEGNVSGLSVKEAKGKTPINIELCRSFYRQLWDEYFRENSELLDLIKPYKGFSDIFGQAGRACQAEEIFRIWKGLDAC
jgi:hypothetical protein